MQIILNQANIAVSIHGARVYAVLFWLVVIPVLVLPSTANAQSERFGIEGRLIETKDNSPLPAANVYLANTTFGAATDSTGHYIIGNIPPGVYQLTFSYVGYEPFVKEVVLEGDPDTLYITAFLKPDPAILDSLVVEEQRPAEWIELKKQFVKLFLGYSDHAANSTIENVEQLDFDLSPKGILTAQSSGPLKIRNNSLGYQLYIVLDSFRWNIQTDRGKYVIYPRFERLQASGNRELEQWIANRLDSFRGSLKHFLGELYQGNIEKSPFQFNRRLIRELNEKEMNQVLKRVKNLPESLKQSIKGYRIVREARIRYEPSESSVYGGGGSDISESILTPAPGNSNQVFFVDPWGNLLDPNSLSLSGAWASDRVADMLPFHYNPPE